MGEQVTEIVLVVEEPEHAVGRVYVNVYGAVPPPAVDVQVNADPAVPLAQERLLVTGWAATTTVVDAVAVALPVLESFATLLMV